MELHNLENRTIGGYTTFGSVWKKNEVKDPKFTLLNGQGKKIPVQTRISAWWPDGSVKWAAHTADSEQMGDCVSLIPEKNGGKVSQSPENMLVRQDGNGYRVNTGRLSLLVPAAGCGQSGCIAKDIRMDGKLIVSKAYPVLALEHRGFREMGGCAAAYAETENCPAVIESVEMEESGPLQCVFCFKGAHGPMRFAVRMYLWNGSPEIRFVHTFFFAGKEENDYLKCMGIRFDAALAGPAWERHVKIATDRNLFHEAAMLLFCNHPRVAQDIYQNQMDGGRYIPKEGDNVKEAVKHLPMWNRFALCQDSPSHFQIKKQIRPECCTVSCLHGYRAPGVMAVAGEAGGLMIGIKDFWQKYPSGLEADGLGDENTCCTAWFYSPEAEAYDFRHYTTESYNLSLYEGFEKPGPSAYGIAVTSECLVKLTGSLPSDGEVKAFADRTAKGPVYVGTPEYYHDKRAFGYWSLRKENTETEKWLEEQLDRAFEFYQDEIENRSWYGLFDYGDIMHTYDKVRHCWRYDMGGFAWQNTELVPTYWLWLYFLRTGREDVYTVMEAMSRHCSEVDIYHFGPKKGIGSRHNVRHWGCSCKEPRVSMAGHHRYLYYLTGDYRLGDVFEDVRDADQSMGDLYYYMGPGADGSEKLCVRSGPDWSSFVSNWMTEYERTLDQKYLERIERGLSDIAAAPFRLLSGPGFEYDMESGHLIYKGEDEETPNMHLQVCMGGPEIWLELADMLEHEGLRQMLIEHGRFYWLPKEEKIRLTGGQITNRSFGFPIAEGALAAYAARETGDQDLMELTWKILADAMLNGRCGIEPVTYAVQRGQNGDKELQEEPWISTNFISQWCLNVIVALEFIREALPESMDTLRDMVKDMGNIPVQRR